MSLSSSLFKTEIPNDYYQYVPVDTFDSVGNYSLIEKMDLKHGPFESYTIANDPSANEKIKQNKKVFDTFYDYHDRSRFGTYGKVPEEEIKASLIRNVFSSFNEISSTKRNIC